MDIYSSFKQQISQIKQWCIKVFIILTEWSFSYCSCGFTERSKEWKVVTGEQSWQNAWDQMLPYVNHEAINMWGFLAEKLLLVSKKRILRFFFSLHCNFSTSLTSELQDWQTEVDRHASYQTNFIHMPSKYTGFLMTEKWEESTVKKQVVYRFQY